MKKFTIENQNLELFFEEVSCINFSSEDFEETGLDFITVLECDCTEEQEREIEQVINNL
jgi:hypothetical protein